MARGYQPVGHAPGLAGVLHPLGPPVGVADEGRSHRSPAYRGRWHTFFPTGTIPSNPFGVRRGLGQRRLQGLCMADTWASG